MNRKKPDIKFKEYNQNQMMLFPPSLEELIGDNHLVRVVNSAIEKMNISPLLKQYKGGGTSSYHPKMLLKLLVYGYTQKIYSSRNIAKAIRENIHFMWLAGGNRPNFRTINNFRSSRLKNVVEEVFISVVELLEKEGYIKFDNYFLDGTIVEANANKYSFVWKKSTKYYKTKLKDKVSTLLNHIEEVNNKENEKYKDDDLEELGKNATLTSDKLEKAIEKLDKKLSNNSKKKRKIIKNT